MKDNVELLDMWMVSFDINEGQGYWSYDGCEYFASEEKAVARAMEFADDDQLDATPVRFCKNGDEIEFVPCKGFEELFYKPRKSFY